MVPLGYSSTSAYCRHIPKFGTAADFEVATYRLRARTPARRPAAAPGATRPIAAPVEGVGEAEAEAEPEAEPVAEEALVVIPVLVEVSVPVVVPVEVEPVAVRMGILVLLLLIGRPVVKGSRGKVSSGRGFGRHVWGGSTSRGSLGFSGGDTSGSRSSGSGTSRDNRGRGSRSSRRGRRDSGRCTGSSSAGGALVGLGDIELLGLGEDAGVLGLSGDQVDLEAGAVVRLSVSWLRGGTIEASHE